LIGGAGLSCRRIYILEAKAKSQAMARVLKLNYYCSMCNAPGRDYRRDQTPGGGTLLNSTSGNILRQARCRHRAKYSRTKAPMTTGEHLTGELDAPGFPRIIGRPKRILIQNRTTHPMDAFANGSEQTRDGVGHG